LKKFHNEKERNLKMNQLKKFKNDSIEEIDEEE
jgi:hypothetical protein